MPRPRNGGRVPRRDRVSVYERHIFGPSASPQAGNVLTAFSATSERSLNLHKTNINNLIFRFVDLDKKSSRESRGRYGVFDGCLKGTVHFNQPAEQAAARKSSKSPPSLPHTTTPCQHLFAGYVPIAPGQALSYTADAFASLDVPALIVYGELDRMGAKASSLLQAIPNSRLLMVPGASHPCYLDEPALFHNRLLMFLRDDAVFPPRGRKLSDAAR